jgi:hypothetical protein
MTPNKAASAIGSLQPGQSIIYYIGHLIEDREDRKVDLDGKRGELRTKAKQAREIGDYMWRFIHHRQGGPVRGISMPHISRAGQGYLLQRRVSKPTGPNRRPVFQYIFVKANPIPPTRNKRANEH